MLSSPKQYWSFTYYVLCTIWSNLKKIQKNKQKCAGNTSQPRLRTRKFIHVLEHFHIKILVGRRRNLIPTTSLLKTFLQLPDFIWDIKRACPDSLSQPAAGSGGSRTNPFLTAPLKNMDRMPLSNGWRGETIFVEERGLSLLCSKVTAATISGYMVDRYKVILVIRTEFPSSHLSMVTW